MAIKLMPGEYNRYGASESESFLSSLEPKANLILAISVIVLIVSLSAWGGLWLYRDNITKEKDLVAGRIEELEAKRDVEVEDMLIELDRGIKRLEAVLEDRIYPVNILEVLEDLVLPEAVFSDFNSDVADGDVSIKVMAVSYAKLAEQMVVFKEDPRIKEVKFSGVSLNENGSASADFQVSLDPELLTASD